MEIKFVCFVSFWPIWSLPLIIFCGKSNSVSIDVFHRGHNVPVLFDCWPPGCLSFNTHSTLAHFPVVDATNFSQLLHICQWLSQPICSIIPAHLPVVVATISLKHFSTFDNELEVEERLRNFSDIYIHKQFECKKSEDSDNKIECYELDELYSWGTPFNGIGYPFIIGQHPTLKDYDKQGRNGAIMRAIATYMFQAFSGIFAKSIAWLISETSSRAFARVDANCNNGCVVKTLPADFTTAIASDNFQAFSAIFARDIAIHISKTTYELSNKPLQAPLQELCNS